MLGLADVKNISRRPHRDYSKDCSRGDLDAVFSILSEPVLECGTLPELSLRSSVPVDTLKTWRKKLKSNPEWRPNPHRDRPPRSLTVEQEDAIARAVDKHIADHHYLPGDSMAILARLSVPGVACLQVEDICPPKLSRTWRRNFMRRHGFSMRRFHVQRRSKPDDAEVSSFIAEHEIALDQFLPEDIVNMDETSWKVLNNRMVTVAHVGQDEVSCGFNASSKQCITVIASVTRAGERLPLWAIVRGDSDQAAQKVRDDPRLQPEVQRGNLIVVHSHNGWTTADIAIQYIRWLHKRNNKSHKYLIWDMFSAHQAQKVKEMAAKKHVHLAFVPRGQTGTWQPLDYRIFGSLKQKAKARFDKEIAAAYVRGEEPHVTRNDALVMLLQIWKGTPQDEVLNAWNRLG